MKTIKQTILGLALSVFSITAFAQCPTSVSVTVLSNTNNGNLTVSQVFNIPTSTTVPMSNSYSLYGANSFYGSSYGMGGSYTFNNIPSGTYSLCVMDSSFCGGPATQFLYNCTMVTITNTAVATMCNASYTQYTDSNCLTHFVNNSTGSNLTYEWYEFPSFTLLSSAANPVLNLGAGNHSIGLYTYSNGNYCDSLTQTVNVNCSGSGTNTPCTASFYTYTDSACLTHFINTTPCTYSTSSWNINGTNYFTASPALNLANGVYNVTLNASIVGTGVSSYNDSVYVNCTPGGTTTPCQASFYAYTDSNTCLTHFINTTACTTFSNYWSINGTYYTTASPALSLANGTYTVSLTVGTFVSGMSTATNSIIVNCSGTGTVNPTTCQVNSQFAIFGDSVNIGNYFAYNMSTGNGSLSYLWNFGDGSSSTQAYPFHQYATPGNYIVCLTVTNTTGTLSCTDTDCDSSSVQRMASGFLMSQINILAPSSPTSVKENITTIKNINAFPNPMGDALMVEVELSALVNNMSYTIVDALGKIVSKNDMIDSKTTINTSGLDKGFYFLTISTNDGSAVKTIKLVK